MKRPIVCLLMATLMVCGCSPPPRTPTDAAKLVEEMAVLKESHMIEIQGMQRRILDLEGQISAMVLRIDELLHTNEDLRARAEQLTMTSDSLYLRTASMVKYVPVELLSKEQLLYLFIDGLHTGDASVMNRVFSDRFLSYLPNGKYTSIKSSFLASIQVYSGLFGNNGNLTHVIEFTVLNEDGPFWQGTHSFFPVFVMDAGRLKIDALPTSPH